MNLMNSATKYFLSRAQTKALSADYPVGDPFGGPAYGLKQDPVSAMVAATIGSSLIGADAASDASNAQMQAADRSAGTQLAMYNQNRADSAPWRQAGESSLSQISAMQPQFTRSFNASDLNSTLAPNYQFQLDQGLGAVKNAGNMQTGLLSGNTIKGVNDYAQNFAGNAYQQAFNNYNAQQTNIFNRLSNIAGLGQTANQTTTNAGTTAASNIGNAQQAAGASQAAGIVGGANALSGGLSNAASWYSLPQIMGGGGNFDSAVNSMWSN